MNNLVEPQTRPNLSVRNVTGASNRRLALFMCATSLFLAGFASAQPITLGGPVTRVLSPDGTAPDAFTAQPHLSFDGRYLVFSSKARNLLPGMPADVPDAELQRQWYVLDRQTRQLDRVSVNNQGDPQESTTQPSTSHTRLLDISDDGRYVVFDSPSTNLTTFIPIPLSNIFLHDRITKTTRLISDGERFSIYPRFVDGQANQVAFACLPTEQVNQGGASSEVCFANPSSGTIRRVVLPSPYLALGRISKNGRYVPCYALSVDLGTKNAQVARCDLRTGQALPIFELTDSQATQSFLVRFSADGSVAAFPFSGNLDCSTPGFVPYLNVYSWHAATGQIRLLSESRSGFPAVSLGAARVSISEDGKRVAFISEDANLVLEEFFDFQARFAVYVRDLDQNYNTYGALLALPPRGFTNHPGIASCEFRTAGFPFPDYNTATGAPNCPELSGDGKTLAFSSHDWRWVAGDLPQPALCSTFTMTLCSRMIDVFVKSLGPTEPANVVPVPTLTPNGSLVFASSMLLLGMWVTRRNTAL